MQARFLIPMAVSLAFGVIFATFITLVLLPSGYRIMEDIKRLPGRLRGQRTEDEAADRPQPASPPEIGAPAARASQQG